MVQDSDSFNAIEGAADRSQLQNVRLSIFDVSQPRLARFPSRVSKACPADIDRQNARVRKVLGHLGRVLAGAAPGDENIPAGAQVTAVGSADMPFHLAGLGS